MMRNTAVKKVQDTYPPVEEVVKLVHCEGMLLAGVVERILSIGLATARPELTSRDPSCSQKATVKKPTALTE